MKVIVKMENGMVTELWSIKLKNHTEVNGKMVKEMAKVSAFYLKNLSMKEIMLLTRCKEKESILLRMGASIQEIGFKDKDMVMEYKETLRVQYMKDTGFKTNNMD